MNLETARGMLKEIRETSGLASERWQATFDAEAQVPEISTKDNMTGEIEPIAHLLPACGHADRRLMTNAPSYVLALLKLLDHSFEIIRKHQAAVTSREPKNYATECAMKCAEPAFRAFLEECHSLARPLNDERVATRVRSILNIRSRADLNTDRAAAARWRDLVKAYDAWRRR